MRYDTVGKLVSFLNSLPLKMLTNIRITDHSLQLRFVSAQEVVKVAQGQKLAVESIDDLIALFESVGFTTENGTLTHPNPHWLYECQIETILDDEMIRKQLKNVKPEDVSAWDPRYQAKLLEVAKWYKIAKTWEELRLVFILAGYEYVISEARFVKNIQQKV